MFAGQPAGAITRIVRTSPSSSLPSASDAATSAAAQNHGGFDFKRIIDDFCRKDQPLSSSSARTKHDLVSTSDNADDGDDESDEEEEQSDAVTSSSRRFQPNTRFLGNVLKSALLHNERVEHVQTSRGGISELDSGAHIEVHDPRGEFAHEKQRGGGSRAKASQEQQLFRSIQRAQSDGMILNEASNTGLSSGNRRVTKGRGKFSGGMQGSAADGIFESLAPPASASSASTVATAAHLHTPAQRSEYQKTHDRYRRARGVALLHQVANHYGISITIHPANNAANSKATETQVGEGEQENENRMQEEGTPPSDDADVTTSNEQKSDSVISKVRSISLSRTTAAAASPVPTSSSSTKVIRLSRSESNPSSLSSASIRSAATSADVAMNFGQPVRRLSDEPEPRARKIITLKSSVTSSPSPSPPSAVSSSQPSSSSSSTVIQLQRKRKEAGAETSQVPSAATAATVPASAVTTVDDPLAKRIKLTTNSSSVMRNRPLTGILGAALKGIARLP